MLGKIAGIAKTAAPFVSKGLGIASAAMSAAGPILGAASQAQAQYDNQKEFAQHGIRWKVADAKAAGIHPLYALGAQTTAYSPQSVGQPDLGSMGANISDSVARTSTSSQRTAMVLQDLAIERASLENNLIRQQIESSRLATMASLRQPSFPAPGGATGSPELDGLVSRSPMTQTVTRPGLEHQEPAHNPAVGYLMNPDGSMQAVQSDVAKERLEEDVIGSIGWNIENRLKPFFGENMSPPPYPPPAGHIWAFDGITYRAIPDVRANARPDPESYGAAFRPTPRPVVRRTLTGWRGPW